MENYSVDSVNLEEIRKFHDKEIAASRWSNPIPDHVGSGLNNGIPKADAKVSYDDMHLSGQIMWNEWCSFPSWKIVTFESDVAFAFLNLPAHPIWQLCQIVTVDSKLFIVWQLVFGNRASPCIWCAVSGLLCWIAIHKFDICTLNVDMDNFFGVNFADNLVFFHGKLHLHHQV